MTNHTIICLMYMFKVLHAHLRRLSVTAVTKGSSEVLASETLAVALVGSVEVPSAVLAIKRVDPASTKQKEELQYPDALQKPLSLQPGTQLKVWTRVSIRGSEAKHRVVCPNNSFLTFAVA